MLPSSLCWEPGKRREKRDDERGEFVKVPHEESIGCML